MNNDIQKRTEVSERWPSSAGLTRSGYAPQTKDSRRATLPRAGKCRAHETTHGGDLIRGDQQLYDKK